MIDATRAGGLLVPADSAETVVRLEGLSKAFGPLVALKSVDLAVQRGEVVVIIGPSGSGKSTLLRCINRLEEPTSGRVFVGGVELTSRSVNLNQARRDIGFVFQSFNLYPHMTALGNVSLALRLVLRMRKAEAVARASEALREVGLSDKAGAYPGQLSGGQQQRVGIARALALEPKVILLDEPTSSLDPELVREVLSAIRRLRDKGQTMVIVSHEMEFAREAADRVVFMAGGEIVEQDIPARLFSAPTHARTREFLSRILRV